MLHAASTYIAVRSDELRQPHKGFVSGSIFIQSAYALLADRRHGMHLSSIAALASPRTWRLWQTFVAYSHLTTPPIIVFTMILIN